jgi:uroporphyrin-III C-methyltransferase
MSGKVYLVGAGPGDPELLTLKALRLLKTADVVLHDDLVPPEILKLASPPAQARNVGKRCGTKAISQEEINFLMVSLAGSGAQVVRLKSGDPFIFGRGGEEVEALRRAGIDCEIVPGVTAALGAAAAAQIPLTHRRISHALIFLIGHVADKREYTDWKTLVTSGATLAIYMPGHNYADLAERLMHAGLNGETPCAVISAATMPNQKTEFNILRKLLDSRRFPNPVVVFVGEVVRLAESSAGKSSQDHDFLNFTNLPAVLSEVRRFAAEKQIA